MLYTILALKILENSQENTRSGIFLSIVAVFKKLRTLLKKFRGCYPENLPNHCE